MDQQTLYWRYKEASEKTGIPIGTLYSMVSLKKIPHVRLGKKHVLFSVTDLLAWLEAHEIEKIMNEKEA